MRYRIKDLPSQGGIHKNIKLIELRLLPPAGCGIQPPLDNVMASTIKSYPVDAVEYLYK